MLPKSIIKRAADVTGLSKELIEKVYKIYWKAIREHITALPLKDNLTDEEFLKLKPNVNIPSIGKLCVTPERYKRINKAYQQRVKQQSNKQKDNVTHQKY